MARVRMVTRTVDLTTVKAMQVNIDNAQVSIEEHYIGGTFDSNETILKVLNKRAEPNIKIVNIESVTVTQELYGMPEELFLEYAEKLPPRGTTED